jgi:murein tripeptide amidase MpaA
MMKKGIVLVFMFCFFFVLYFSGNAVEEKAKMYTVSGKRHGPSYFAIVNYPQAKPMVEGKMDFDHYHKYDEVIEFLKKWEKEYPDLVELYSVGKSFEGRDIWQITITNKLTGKDTDKPAMFLEGNRHSGEVTAAESALYFAWHVLTQYNKDPEITELVDTKAIYVRVKNNPDGSLLYLNTAQTNRSSVRPHDGDRDGLLDEDPLEDLDGDGFCFQGDYKVYSEGLDNDSDGQFNEDGIGGLDLHRNYPENWRPEPGLDLTGRGWTQRGAGAYPLSEPETRSVVIFLLQHPNVSVGQSMDTTVPMHLRPPSTSKSEESMFEEDLKLYRYFDEQGKKITGYPYAGDVYWDFSGRRYTSGRSEGERRGRPLFGHSPDFGYFYYGAIWYGDELWSGGRVKDYDGDGGISDLEVLKWNDEELEGRGFKDWEKFNHPELGEVEIGGYNPKFFRQNPPPEFLEEWAKKEAMFNLMLAKSLPQVKIVSVKSERVQGEKDTYKINAVFTNQGFLPTALEMAKRIKIVKPDYVELKFSEKEMEIIEGESRIELGFLKSHEEKNVTWRIKAIDKAIGDIEISIHSTRGGVERKKISLSSDQ